MPSSEVMLAEALKAQGYQTTTIGKWHLGAQDGFFPTENGFVTYFGILYSNDIMPPWVQTQRPLELWCNTEPIEHPIDQTTLPIRHSPPRPSCTTSPSIPTSGSAWPRTIPMSSNASRRR